MALMIGIFAFFRGQDGHLKVMIGLQALFMAGHFLLLGAWVGALLGLWGATRYFMSAWGRHRDALMWFFIVGGTMIGMWRYQTPTDILPIIANILACIAIFKLQGLQLKGLLLIVSSCWLGYNAAHASVMGAMVEAFYMVANATAIVQGMKAKKV